MSSKPASLVEASDEVKDLFKEQGLVFPQNGKVEIKVDRKARKIKICIKPENKKHVGKNISFDETNIKITKDCYSLKFENGHCVKK